MKKLFFLVLIPLSMSFQTVSETVGNNDWKYDLESAKKLAKKQDKNILVYFTGSDWCPPCKMLKKDFFDTKEFSEAAKNYILVYVDMPRNKDLLSTKQMQHNKAVITAHNKRGVFPLLKVLDAKGKSLDEYSGYSMNGDVRYHLKLLKKHQ